MDRVRLGRALGYGARHAAKTLYSAVDAATAPNPRASSTAKPAANPAAKPAPVAGQMAQAYRSAGAAKRHVRGAGRGMLGPLKSFSSVIALQVTGTFFALFAVFMGQGVWKLRESFKAPVNSPEAHKLYFHLVVFLGFAYFTVSNFARASRLEQKARR